MTTKALGLIVMLIGVGCAKPSSQLKPETLVAPNDRIGASSAADYYRNFYMGVVGKCEISTLPLYDRFLMGEVVFTENPRLRITLFLRPNYTYVAQMTGSKII
ncbi:MAG: hypothetical protein K2P92_04775, partial [Bdellovibrionaceae bacterium]|nr:hypothetical protein [Pseudobdellovibrionaceae bacterium]